MGNGSVPIGRYAVCHATWQKMNPTCEVKLWSVPMLSELIEKTLPWFENAWSLLRDPMHRLDVARPLVLLAEGGVYVDMDIRCTKSIEPIFLQAEKDQTVQLWKSHFWNDTRRCGVYNHMTTSFMMGPKGHAFWLNYLLLAKKRIEGWKWFRNHSWYTTIGMTGPWLTHAAYTSNRSSVAFHVWNPTDLFPLKHEEMAITSAYGVDELQTGYGLYRTIAADILRIMIVIILLAFCLKCIF